MASTLGQIAHFGNANRKTCILPPTSANVAAPTLASAGVPMFPTNALASSDDGVCITGFAAREAFVSVFVSGTTPTAILTLYGYIAAANGGAGAWFPIQKLNAGGAITANYAERVLNVGLYDRLAVGVASIGGTTPNFEAWIGVAVSGKA